MDCTVLFGLYSFVWTVQSCLDCTVLFGLYSLVCTLQSCLHCTALLELYSLFWTVQSCLDCTVLFGLYSLFLDCSVLFGLHSYGSVKHRAVVVIHCCTYVHGLNFMVYNLLFYVFIKLILTKCLFLWVCKLINVTSWDKQWFLNNSFMIFKQFFLLKILNMLWGQPNYLILYVNITSQ